MAKVEESRVTLDTTDVDRHLGQPVGGGQLKEPVAVNDIRRWVQGMQYANPLHYDDVYAAQTRFGRIVAPQSFTICCDVGHGAGPAIVGSIPGTHMIFGGDEWWFGGPRILPGDLLRMERRFHDYKVSDTKFAGPTMFSRGDTLYRNQRDDVVALQRSTSVRYLAEEARRLGFFEQTAPRPEWTDEQLANVENMRLAWIRSNRQGETPRWGDVEAGMQLPRRAIGPHTIASFATEWRSYTFTVWGSSYQEGPEHLQEAGWLPEMERNLEAGEEDPALTDGLYRGPSAGTPTRSTRSSSACRAATGTARRWAPGCWTTSGTGPATRVSCGTRTCSTGSRRSRATSRTSTPRSPASVTTRRSASRSSPSRSS